MTEPEDDRDSLLVPDHSERVGQPRRIPLDGLEFIPCKCGHAWHAHYREENFPDNECNEPRCTCTAYQPEDDSIDASGSVLIGFAGLANRLRERFVSQFARQLEGTVMQGCRSFLRMLEKPRAENLITPELERFATRLAYALKEFDDPEQRVLISGEASCEAESKHRWATSGPVKCIRCRVVWGPHHD